MVSKPLGILLIGYSSWILSRLHILPSVRVSILALLLVLAGLSGRYVWRHRREFIDFIVRERYAIIAGEIIFLVFFVGWMAYRAYDPGINHTEQPMDLGLLNASINSSFGSPDDPWLSGESVSYYYFGYWMMGAISELTGVAAQIAYNLSLALISAMAAMAAFGLTYNIVRSEATRLRYAVIAGIAAVVLLGVAANLEGVLELLMANGMGSMAFWEWLEIKGLDGADPSRADGWVSQEFWWWFRATRVINSFDAAGQELDFTIQEFPFFSFMLGDLHPHVMSIPFLILFMHFVWNWLRSPAVGWKGLGLQGYTFLVVMGLALGGLAFINLWDLPTFAVLFLAVASMRTYGLHGGGLWSQIKGVIPVGAMVIGLAVVFFIPYYNNVSGSVSGLDPVVAATTRPVHIFIVWGLFLVAVVPLILATFWQTPARKGWPRTALVSLFIGFLPYLAWAYLHLQTGGTTGGLWRRFFEVLPLALLISGTIYAALWVVKEHGPCGRAFALVLSALALMLIMGPELLLVNDFFDLPLDRMNTVFKLYYQAWVLLAVASAFAIYYWGSVTRVLCGWKLGLSTVWAGAFVVLLVGSLYYAPSAAASKGDIFAGAGLFTSDSLVDWGDATLDGLAYVERSRHAEYEAIRFVNENLDSDDAIVEAVGEWADWGLISRSTGVPTVFNWPGHEIQWRGSPDKFDGRERDVELIYQSGSAQEAKILLEKYVVDYVYVGHREREKYGTEGLAKFPTFMETVFSQDDVVIYRLAR